MSHIGFFVALKQKSEHRYAPPKIQEANIDKDIFGLKLYKRENGRCLLNLDNIKCFSFSVNNYTTPG